MGFARIRQCGRWAKAQNFRVPDAAKFVRFHMLYTSGVVVKGAALVAGFEGVNKLTDLVEGHHAAQPAPAAAQPAADTSTDDQSN